MLSANRTPAQPAFPTDPALDPTPAARLLDAPHPPRPAPPFGLRGGALQTKWEEPGNEGPL